MFNLFITRYLFHLTAPLLPLVACGYVWPWWTGHAYSPPSSQRFDAPQCLSLTDPPDEACPAQTPISTGSTLRHCFPSCRTRRKHLRSRVGICWAVKFREDPSFSAPDESFRTKLAGLGPQATPKRWQGCLSWSMLCYRRGGCLRNRRPKLSLAIFERILRRSAKIKFAISQV